MGTAAALVGLSTGSILASKVLGGIKSAHGTERPVIHHLLPKGLVRKFRLNLLDETSFSYSAALCFVQVFVVPRLRSTGLGFFLCLKWIVKA